MDKFLHDETGAVTVDWVVLTAAIVGLGLAVMAVVSGGVENLSNETAVELASIDVGASPFTGIPSGYPTLGDWAAYGADIGNTNISYDGYVADLASMDTNDIRNEAIQWAAIAADTSESANVRAVHADAYNAAYSELQNRGEDVSALANPADVNASAT